ncbi:MAG: hypothetical protein JNM18_12505 [Planctomycetaceae bacterium]|nr:hypothetical protein [Planctomycetaceae bacterium]
MTYVPKQFGSWKRLANSLRKQAGGLNPRLGFRENYTSMRGHYALEDLDVHVIYDNRPTYPEGLADKLKKVLKAEKIKVLAYSEGELNWVMIVDIPANMEQRFKHLFNTAFAAVFGHDAIFRDYNHNT